MSNKIRLAQVHQNGAHTRDTTVDTATTITHGTADGIMIQPLVQNVRITFDGTAPTADVGFRLTAGTLYSFSLDADCTVKVISETAGAEVQYQLQNGV